MVIQDLSKPLNVEKEIKLYSGSGNRELAQKIADRLGLTLSGLKLEKFANGELYARFEESVRGDDVFVIQSMAGQNVNDLLMELLIIIDAAKRASARSVTAVIPHYAYARQDRKAAPRPPSASPTTWAARSPSRTRAVPSTTWPRSWPSSATSRARPASSTTT